MTSVWEEAERRMSMKRYRQAVARMDRMTSNRMWENTPHVWFHAACGHGRFARHAYGLGEMGQMDDEIQKAWERLDRANHWGGGIWTTCKMIPTWRCFAR